MSETIHENFFSKPPIEDNLYTHDYRYVLPERREFVIPHEAFGDEIETISSVDSLSGAKIEIPAMFKIARREFYLTGVQENTKSGVIYQGLISGNIAKIHHVDVAKDIRRTGISAAFLQALENDLQKHGVDTIYSSFDTPTTVEFFIKHGYEIVPYSSLDLPAKQKDALDLVEAYYDEYMQNTDDFIKMRQKGVLVFSKILAVKHLNSESTPHE